MYYIKDVLVKLNAVEIISKIGKSKWNAKFISEHKIFSDILKDAFDDN